jgi:hypothetical protein
MFEQHQDVGIDARRRLLSDKQLQGNQTLTTGFFDAEKRPIT